MKWTKEKPSGQGWYWWKRDPYVTASIEHIYVGRTDGALFMYLPRGAGVAVDRLPGEWAGPIQEPEEA